VGKLAEQQQGPHLHIELVGGVLLQDALALLLRVCDGGLGHLERHDGLGWEKERAD
jgi:hypothetical protein